MRYFMQSIFAEIFQRQENEENEWSYGH